MYVCSGHRFVEMEMPIKKREEVLGEMPMTCDTSFWRASLFVYVMI